MRIVGLDPSLTGTGIAGNGWSTTITTKPRRGMDRLDYLRRNIADYTRGADLVVMEGLAYHGHDTGRQLAGLSWLLRHMLWSLDVPYAVVPPSNLKRFATGDGSSRTDKAAVVAAVSGWFAWFDGDHNAADAAVLAAMGHQRLGVPLVELPHRNRSAMQGCEWPELAVMV